MTTASSPPSVSYVISNSRSSSQPQVSSLAQPVPTFAIMWNASEPTSALTKTPSWLSYECSSPCVVPSTDVNSVLHEPSIASSSYAATSLKYGADASTASTSGSSYVMLCSPVYVATMLSTSVSAATAKRAAPTYSLSSALP